MSVGRLRAAAAAWAPPLLVGIVAFGCGGSAYRAATTTTRPAAAVDVHVTASDFRSMKTMTPIRGFFVANLLGNLDATVAVATSRTGGVYPTGTLLQLVPQEAMVKHRTGWNAATRDWEFFTLDVSPAGTKIVSRGVEKVVNRFGGNCASCHAAAKAQFDFVCEHDHGCAPLPIGDDIIRTIQLADPRPAA